jgi:YVTN family beta-propeller protein
MTGVGHLLFVTLPFENRVAIINTETLTVIDEIHTQGDYPHTVILAGGNYLNRGP